MEHTVHDNMMHMACQLATNGVVVKSFGAARVILFRAMGVAHWLLSKLTHLKRSAMSIS